MVSLTDDSFESLQRVQWFQWFQTSSLTAPDEISHDFSNEVSNGLIEASNDISSPHSEPTFCLIRWTDYDKLWQSLTAICRLLPTLPCHLQNERFLIEFLASVLWLQFTGLHSLTLVLYNEVHGMNFQASILWPISWPEFSGLNFR